MLEKEIKLKTGKVKLVSQLMSSNLLTGAEATSVSAMSVALPSNSCDDSGMQAGKEIDSGRNPSSADIGSSVGVDIRTETIRRHQEIIRCLSTIMRPIPKGVNKYSVSQVIAEYAAQDYAQLEYQVAAQLKEAMREDNVKDWYKAICVLGEIYRKRQEYTKSTALYNYAINLCKVKKEEVQEWENKIEEIRLILAEIENEFIEGVLCRKGQNFPRRASNLL
jgi:hypothetical protein